MQQIPSEQYFQSEKKILFERIKELEASNSWKLIDEKPCFVFIKEFEGRFQAKGIAQLNIPFQKVVDFFSQEDFMKKVNKEHLDTFKVLHKPSNDASVIYLKMNGFGPISDREMVVMLTKFYQHQGRFILALKSSNFPYPENPDIIRAEIFAGAYFIEKIGEKKTKLTHVSDSDPKGSVFDFVKEMMAKKRAGVVGAIEQIINDQK